MSIRIFDKGCAGFVYASAHFSLSFLYRDGHGGVGEGYENGNVPIEQTNIGGLIRCGTALDGKRDGKGWVWQSEKHFIIAQPWISWLAEKAQGTLCW